jgi:two-component system, NarL family, response regulator NreC
MSRIRVLLVDDHTLLRAGLRALLDAAPEMEVVGEAADGDEAAARVTELEPDVVLMDLSMPGIGGLEATRRITSSGSNTRVLVLTMHRAEEFLIPVLQAGGSGYVTKESADGELLEAIRTVASGHVFLYPSAARLLLENYRGPQENESESDPLEVLSGREREVLLRTAGGFTASEIGEQLQISPKTVDTYRQRVMEKLHLRHRSELVQFALKRGLLQPMS